MMLAHLGHWYVSLLYIGPVAVLAGYLGVQHRRDKRRSHDEGSE